MSELLNEKRKIIYSKINDGRGGFGSLVSGLAKKIFPGNSFTIKNTPNPVTTPYTTVPVASPGLNISNPQASPVIGTPKPQQTKQRVVSTPVNTPRFSPQEISKLTFSESSNNPTATATGVDNNQYRGMMQMGSAAWEDVNAKRAREGLPTYDYNKHWKNPEINSLYGAIYLNDVVPTILRNTFGIEPTKEKMLIYYKGFIDRTNKRVKELRELPIAVQKQIQTVLGLTQQKRNIIKKVI